MNKKCISILMSLTLIFLASQPSLANERLCENNICFEAKVNNPQMNLFGVSKFKYLFFDVYVGAYYSELSLNKNQNIFDPIKSARLELEYLREITKEDFIRSTRELLNKNKTINLALVETKFAKVYDAFEDVKAGDRYRLDYTPNGEETCLYLNGQKKLCERGLEFYKAFFGIWLSNYSVDREFTAKLLVGNKIN